MSAKCTVSLNPLCFWCSLLRVGVSSADGWLATCMNKEHVYASTHRIEGGRGGGGEGGLTHTSGLCQVYLSHSVSGHPIVECTGAPG